MSTQPTHMTLNPLIQIKPYLIINRFMIQRVTYDDGHTTIFMMNKELHTVSDMGKKLWNNLAHGTDYSLSDAHPNDPHC